MLRRSITLWGGFHSGGWSPGSRGQKHVALCPTHYLYRIAGHKGPGYYMMKYWWTLGTFPTGMEAPFRLHEFLATYREQHVPVEVEEWLCHFVKNPAEDIVPNAQAFINLLERVPDRQKCPYKKIHVTNAKPLKESMDKFLAPVGLSAPGSAVRAVASSNTLKGEMLDLVFAYRSTVKEHGSTPHRRWAAGDLMLADRAKPALGRQQQQLSGRSAGDGDGNGGAGMSEQLHVPTTLEGARDEVVSEVREKVGDAALSKPMSEHGLSAAAAKQIGWVLDVNPDETAPDEALLINILTTLAQGSSRINKHEDAAVTLTSALMFAHDDETRGRVHSNVASARCRAGDFGGAEWHAKEAVILTDAAHSFATLAAALAHQDKTQEANDVVKEGLASHPEDAVLLQQREKLLHITATKPDVPEELKGLRVRLPSQLARGLAESPGIVFGHEFDLVPFKGKMLPFKMDVRNNNMGSIFRRTDRSVNFRISSSQQSEPF